MNIFLLDSYLLLWKGKKSQSQHDHFVYSIRLEDFEQTFHCPLCLTKVGDNVVLEQQME